MFVKDASDASTGHSASERRCCTARLTIYNPSSFPAGRETSAFFSSSVCAGALGGPGGTEENRGNDNQKPRLRCHVQTALLDQTKACHPQHAVSNGGQP